MQPSRNLQNHLSEIFPSVFSSHCILSTPLPPPVILLRSVWQIKGWDGACAWMMTFLSPFKLSASCLRGYLLQLFASTPDLQINRRSYCGKSELILWLLPKRTCMAVTLIWQDSAWITMPIHGIYFSFLCSYCGISVIRTGENKSTFCISSPYFSSSHSAEYLGTCVSQSMCLSYYNDCWIRAFSVGHNWKDFVKVLIWICHVRQRDMYKLENVFWRCFGFVCIYTEWSLYFLQCLKSLPFAIWTFFLIFFVASPFCLYCFVLMFLWSFDDFFLNYLEQLFLIQTQFIPWRIPPALDVLTAVACGHTNCHENFCHAVVGFHTFIHGACGVFSF